MATTTYDARTPILLPPLNILLTRHYLPTITHPSEITPSLLIALYESLIHTRLAAIDRKDKSSTTQIRNIKLLLGTMVMAGWDVGLVDPVGVVEREESCLMDLAEVLVEVGREQYGLSVASTLEASQVLPVGAQPRRELSTIVEATTFDSDDSATSISTLQPIHERADAILSRIQDLNPSLRPSSPTSTTISRATQTSPPPQFSTPRTRRKPKTPKRTPRPTRRKHEKGIQTDEGTESGIPSSIPLSYSSDSSPPIRKPKFPLRNLHTSRILAPAHTRSPVRPPVQGRSRSRTQSSSSESHFRVDSPYTAALRRRRQIAIDSLRKPPRSSSLESRRKEHRIRVFSVGRDVADSTFAEDSDPSPPQRIRPRMSSKLRPRHFPSPAKNRRHRLVSDPESTTDALTDLERRVKALRIWGGIEEERKEFLMTELKRKTAETGSRGEERGEEGVLLSRSQSRSSGGSGS